MTISPDSEDGAAARGTASGSQDDDDWNPYTSATTLAWWRHAFPQRSDETLVAACDAYRRDVEALERAILVHGGERVIRVGFQLFLGQLTDSARAQTWPATRRRRRMVPINCHRNSATLWSRDPERLRVAHGYALSDDGLWRPHSWVINLRARKPETAVIETTEPRLLYYGFVLTSQECGMFARANGVWNEDGDPVEWPPSEACPGAAP